MQDRQLIKINDVAAFQPAGLPWRTIHQARWAYRKRHEYGISAAFVRFGASVLVDVPRFHELARSHAST
jgi:hypothetical protein